MNFFKELVATINANPFSLMLISIPIIAIAILVLHLTGQI